jgi:hypothetical protein
VIPFDRQVHGHVRMPRAIAGQAKSFESVRVRPEVCSRLQKANSPLPFTSPLRVADTEWQEDPIPGMRDDHVNHVLGNRE